MREGFGFDTVQIASEPEAMARASTPGPRDRGALLVLTGAAAGTLLHVGQTPVVVGRAPSADVRVDHPGVSRRHACFYREGERFFVEDLDTINGTWVSGRLVRRSELQDGDRILVGSTLLRFERQDAVEEEALRRLYEAAVRDALTGLYNRRYLGERLDGELSYANRHDAPLALLMIDLDRFKRVNDRYGHPAGDVVLRVVASIIQRMVRPEDVVARFGGEEICVLARNVDGRNAAIFAERIRRAVEATDIPWSDGRIDVTVSIGVAVAGRQRRRTALGLLAAVDAALYEAKGAGRNRVEVERPADPV